MGRGGESEKQNEGVQTEPAWDAQVDLDGKQGAGGSCGGGGGSPDEQIKLDGSDVGKRTQNQLNPRANVRLIMLKWLLLVLSRLENVQKFIFAVKSFCGGLIGCLRYLVQD